VLKLFGISMATAVFLDALVIRTILLPAVLQLMGRRTWAFPSWLHRRLPRLAIEPEAGGRQLEPALEPLNASSIAVACSENRHGYDRALLRCASCGFESSEVTRFC
jgi:hypothetical protein